MKRLSVVPLACVLVVAGCHSTTTCAEYDYYDGTVEVTAVDATTGALVPNTTLTMMVSPIDTAVLAVGSDVSQYPVDFIGIGVGMFQLSIAAPGYATWANRVTVTCAIPPTTVTARLQKSP